MYACKDEGPSGVELSRRTPFCAACMCARRHGIYQLRVAWHSVVYINMPIHMSFIPAALAWALLPIAMLGVQRGTRPNCARLHSEKGCALRKSLRHDTRPGVPPTMKEPNAHHTTQIVMNASCGVRYAAYEHAHQKSPITPASCAAYPGPARPPRVWLGGRQQHPVHAAQRRPLAAASGTAGGSCVARAGRGAVRVGDPAAASAGDGAGLWQVTDHAKAA